VTLDFGSKEHELCEQQLLGGSFQIFSGVTGGDAQRPPINTEARLARACDAETARSAKAVVIEQSLRRFFLSKRGNASAHHEKRRNDAILPKNTVSALFVTTV
jgi:hypothetical protein